MKTIPHRSPPCRLVVVPITVKGRGDLNSSTENQILFASALLRLPQPSDIAQPGVQQSQASD